MTIDRTKDTTGKHQYRVEVRCVTYVDVYINADGFRSAEHAAKEAIERFGYSGIRGIAYITSAKARRSLE